MAAMEPKYVNLPNLWHWRYIVMKTLYAVHGFFAFMDCYGPLLPVWGVCAWHIGIDRLESKMADCVYGINKNYDNHLNNIF